MARSTRVSSSARALRFAILLLCSSLLVTSATSAMRPLQALSKAWRLPAFAPPSLPTLPPFTPPSPPVFPLFPPLPPPAVRPLQALSKVAWRLPPFALLFTEFVTPSFKFSSAPSLSGFPLPSSSPAGAAPSAAAPGAEQGVAATSVRSAFHKTYFLSLRSPIYPTPSPVPPSSSPTPPQSLHDNHLHGPLPDLGKLTLLRELYLHGNNLTGAIPASFGLLPNLEALNLGENALSGRIPLQLGNLKALILLNLNSNRLVGKIPETLGKLSNLQHLELGGNALTGPIPDSFAALTNLLTLDLSPNQLSGPIPPVIGALRKLRWMYLSGNQISGSLPPAIGDLHDLEHLWIEDNKLTGPLPAEIGNCTSLQILYLSNNNISGSVPDSIGRLSSVRDMRLDQNMLSGALPPSIGALSNLTVLELHYNQLSGALPPTLGQLFLLKTLTINSTAQPCPASSSLCQVTQTASSPFCQLCPEFCASCQPPQGGDGSGGDGSGGSGGPSTGAIIAVVCGSLLLLTAVLVAFLVWCCCRPGQSPFKHVKVVDQEEFDDAGLIPSLCCRYSLVEIRRATNNWSEENRIGSGQHSDVYKGTCPYNPASTWAVKRYKERSKNFEKEVEQIASKWHPNLAHLLGYCVDSDTRVEGGRMVQVEEQIAVYEYVHHGDLSRYLYQGESLPLPRCAICVTCHASAATAAREGMVQVEEQMAVYEYVHHGDLSHYLYQGESSDVFSFGVIFLELLTGRPPFIQVQAEHGEDHEHIADWEGHVHIADWEGAAAGAGVPESSFLSLAELAMRCTAMPFTDRPPFLAVSPTHVSPAFHFPPYQAAPLIDEGKTDELKDPHLDVPESSFLSLAELAIRCTAMPFTDRPPMGEVLATLKAIRTDFFGLTDPDDVYGGEGSGGVENGFSGDSGDGDGRGGWGVSVNNV
ncbi:unnamed protein product [Closterium sp. Naga37s-1]|nr:unnamed protein product [Closterium sp. Naga37s-1]